MSNSTLPTFECQSVSTCVHQNTRRSENVQCQRQVSHLTCAALSSVLVILLHGHNLYYTNLYLVFCLLMYDRFCAVSFFIDALYVFICL